MSGADGSRCAGSPADLPKLERKSSDLSGLAAETELVMKAGQDDLERVLAAFYHRIAESEPALAAVIHMKGHADQYGRIQGAKTELVKRQPDLAAVIAEIEDAYKSYQVADTANDGAQTKLKVMQQQIAITRKRHDDAMRANFELIKVDLDKDKDARARIENAFYELNVNNYDCGVNSGDECGLLGGHITRAFYRLLTLRSDLLTLLLVILMGVLGSALQIAHAFFMKDQVQTIGGYFQRISVGAVTALVIFIVAKAGVPIVTDPARLGGEAPINPYFISFLAIVSGLLSENAIANIQAQGAKLFGAGSAEPDRWARSDLTPILKEQQLSTAKLASYLGKSEDIVAPMIEGAEKMDPVEQKTIALYLRRDPRELFTDIPPPAKGRAT